MKSPSSQTVVLVHLLKYAWSPMKIMVAECGKEHCLQCSSGCKNWCQEVLVPLNLLWDVVRLFFVQASEREYLERDRLGASGELGGPSIKTHSLSSESSLDLSGELAAANFLSRFTGATERDAPTLTCSSMMSPTLTCLSMCPTTPPPPSGSGGSS